MTEEFQGSLRLFTGLPAGERLATALSTLPREPKGRWVQPDDYHITIRFLGSVAKDRLPDIRDALTRVSCMPFGIEVSGLSVFSSRRQQLLYAKVVNTRKLNHLCAKVTDALAPLGFDFGTRSFEPHITVAWFDAKTSLDSFVREHARGITAIWQAEGFHLFQSRSTEKGSPRYRSLGWYPFS